MTISDPSDGDAEKHIQRLRALRQSGIVNMFTDVKQGLEVMLDEDEAEETFEWITENWEYYMSGEWTER